MFIPIGDDNHDRKETPIITYLLIAVNIFVFVFWQHFGSNLSFTYAFATVPREILSGHDVITNNQILVDPYSGQTFEMPGLQRTPIPVWLTLITSLFLHGGIAHLAGNMLFLWIFGDNVEDSLGHLNFLLFYLVCGILASLSHVISSFILGQSLLIPSLGASGAISGVLGGYILLFPRRRVRVWFILFIFSVPAYVAVGLWFIFQVVSGLGAMGGENAGNVAYAAHIGGFIFGMLLLRRFLPKNPYGRTR
ncbi:MAG: rhomboid family intramembrane serine protease [Bacteroidetes bacterium]|nr:rhomboid family intramembrane serine protease [Bacteroidota bacterium]MBS1739891.1 rhomboid family intramembrane serine protease [Bacteroidota bacterium]MBS1774837.1 rhomboid family intramembrane serine protease [Bacteroidota bacterium]